MNAMPGRQHQTYPSRFQKGFTLIELLVVVAIVGLLATVAILSLTDMRKKSRDARRLTDVKAIRGALDLYYQDNGGYPNPVALGCAAAASGFYCLGHTAAQTCWIGAAYGCNQLNAALSPYLARIPDDPKNDTSYYGDAYQYGYSFGAWVTTPPALHWGMEQPTNVQNCAGGVSGTWSAGHYWCALHLL